MCVEIDVLCRAVEERLALHPEESPQLLNSIAKGLNKFKSGVEEQRSSHTTHTISGLYSFVLTKKKFSSVDRILLMDALYLSFPSGKMSGHCSYDKEVLAKYIELYKLDVCDKEKFGEWLQMTRGDEFLVWHDKLLTNNLCGE